MMFTSAYTNNSMSVCSASANCAEASFVCAQSTNPSTQTASAIAIVLDTVRVSIFVAIIVAIISILAILGIIRLASLILLAVLLILGQLNSDRSVEPAKVL